jgi:RNA polymerase sigma-70 factor (ECF subfamily)
MSLLPLFGHSAGIAKRLGDSRAGLFRLAFMWCHDRALADDLTQEALAKALLHADELRDAGKLRPWLFGILVNCWRDHLRARRPTEDIDTIEEHWLATEHSSEHTASQAQLAERVRAAIAQLPVGQREVLSLVDLEECTYAEAAQILAIPIGTVMSRLCRGRVGLRDLLADAHTAVQLRRPGMRRVK